MQQLTLASGGAYASLADAVNDNYLRVPTPDGQTVLIREDYFDNLPAYEWEQVMDFIEPYNAPQVNGLFSKWKERRAEKKEARQIKKAERVEKRRDFFKDVASKIGGAITGNVAPAESEMPTRGVESFEIAYGTPKKQWYQNPMVIGGAAAAIAAVIYFSTRKK